MGKTAVPWVAGNKNHAQITLKQGIYLASCTTSWLSKFTSLSEVVWQALGTAERVNYSRMQTNICEAACGKTGKAWSRFLDLPPQARFLLMERHSSAASFCRRALCTGMESSPTLESLVPVDLINADAVPGPG